MAAGIRRRSRLTWPKGLDEVRPGYFVWAPPAAPLSAARVAGHTKDQAGSAGNR